MNVFILTDLEGISGVVDIEYMDRTGEKYKKACSYLAESINLAVDTCIKCGAENVYYLDGHGGGGNANPDDIDKRAVKCDLATWQQLMRDGKIDCQIELGSHARAGTINGFLDHTVTSRQWFCHKVNGMEMSELSLHALVCSTFGVPIVACLGDETACEQAKEYIPDIYVGAVKKASCRNFAENYDNADEILVNTITKALENYKNVSLFRLSEPMEVELTYYRTDMCEEVYQRRPENVLRVDARTLRKQVDKITKYEDLKF